MAMMGDKVLTQWRKQTKYFSTSVAGFGYDADIDGNPSDGLTRAGKSREAKGVQKLAWRNNSINSTYLFPSRLGDAMLNYKFSQKDAFVPGDGSDISSHMIQMQGNRLDPDVVKGVEDILESEYVPFYFHDLRTNEIIAFHAFLSNITDQYSPQWTEVGGIGRVEPVQIYGSTKRSISLEFFAAATSKEDFDGMWYKINKLITLVYPQWSQGRWVDQGDTKFIQPFSNVKTASPIVRIRLGDLLKSNYSRFALARLFGLTEDDFTIEGETSDNDPDALEIIAEKRELLNAFKEIGAYLIGDSITINAGKYKVNELPIGTVSNADSISFRDALKGKVTSIPIPKVSELDDSSTMAGKVAMKSEPSTAGQSTDNDTPTFNLEFVVEIEGNEGYYERFNGWKIVVTNENIKFDQEEATFQAKVLAGILPPLLEPTFLGKFRDFMSPENNAIVRSFESTRGRGLAGAITGLDFTWNDMPWEIERGSKAPKMCKINIQFSPIHDIQPGIDYNGFNRAPVYNVGTIMNGIAFDPYDGGEGG
jgi:hypothetical protein